MINSNCHQITCFKATEELHTPYRADPNQEYSVDIFATLLVLSCLYSSGLRSSCCNVVRFCCDLEACNLGTATIRHKSVYDYKENCILPSSMSVGDSLNLITLLCGDIC
jgi:hypothetical protein